jgi:hypothetical protein
VIWFKDKRRDEGKTYYAADEQDARDTMKHTAEQIKSGKQSMAAVSTESREYLAKVSRKMGWEFVDNQIVVPVQGDNAAIAAKYGMTVEIKGDKLHVDPLKFHGKELSFPKNRKEVDKVIDLITAMQKKTAVKKAEEVSALDKSVSTQLATELKSTPKAEQQTKLEEFVKKHEFKGDDLSDLMYDLERMGFPGLKKPGAPKPAAHEKTKIKKYAKDFHDDADIKWIEGLT